MTCLLFDRIHTIYFCCKAAKEDQPKVPSSKLGRISKSRQTILFQLDPVMDPVRLSFSQSALNTYKYSPTPRRVLSLPRVASRVEKLFIAHSR